MSGGKRVRPLPWLKTQSAAVFKSEYRDTLVQIAGERFPTGAFETARDEVFLGTGDIKLAEKLAQACRWLAVIKRDHGEAAFNLTISLASTTPQVPRLISTGNQKGSDPMSSPVTTAKPAVSTEGTRKRTPTFPLQHLRYRSSVNGAFARSRCIQQFANDTETSVEAVYCFPMPDDASVTACTMVIGERRITAELKPKEEARHEYHTAVAAGHHGALLEQERPNIFTMNVGGIEPGQQIEVEVDYVQRIPWQADGGRFTIPLVVAPRFIPGTPTEVEQRGGGWSPDTVEVPDASRITPVVTRAGVPYTADITVMFAPGFDCRLHSPSHSAVIQSQAVTRDATVELKTGDLTADRDVVLEYESPSSAPEVAVHHGTYGTEHFVQVTILPPGQFPIVASDIMMVLDCSGSMDGAKIEGLKLIAKKVAHHLHLHQVGHRLGILPFDNQPWPAHPLSAISETTDHFIDQLKAGGSTELGAALTAAHQSLSSTERPRVMLLVTDGQTESLNFHGSGARIIVVGIDTAVNDTVIKEVAAKTGGTYEFVYPGEDYDALANRLTGYLSGPVLTNVSVKAAGGESVGVSDVFKGRPAVITTRFAGEPSAITITGQSLSGHTQSWDVDLSAAKASDFVAQVWARDTIRENPDAVQQTAVSLQYGIICQHTAFVAVSLKEVPGQPPTRVDIPVNLPAGWNFDAVFGAATDSISRTRLRPAMASMRAAGFSSLSADCMSLEADDEILLGAASIDDITVASVTPTFDEPVSTRFTLDASHVVDRLVAVLMTISFDYYTAAAEFLNIEELTIDGINALSEEERAIAYYFAARLASFRCQLDASVMNALRAEPQSLPALAWYNLARKEEGLAYQPFDQVAGDAGEYIAWKFGLGPQPTTGDWSVVP